MGVDPHGFGDTPHSRLVLRGHGFAAFIDTLKKGEVVAEGLHRLFHALAEFRLAGRLGERVPFVAAFRFTAQHREAGRHHFDAVVQAVQLGGFIQHRIRRRQFAAVVQPGGHAQLVPAVFVEFEVGEAGLVVTGGARQQLGEQGHALAVRAGVRTLGVDGAGDHLDEGVEQILELLNQQQVIKGDAGVAGQRFEQRQGRGGDGGVVRHPVRMGVHQLQHAHHHPFVVAHRHQQQGIHLPDQQRHQQRQVLRVEAVRAGEMQRLPGACHAHRGPVGVLVVQGQAGAFQGAHRRAVRTAAAVPGAVQPFGVAFFTVEPEHAGFGAGQHLRLFQHGLDQGRQVTLLIDLPGHP